jgi:predicted RNA-binding protein with PUA-like domain
MQYWLMKTEPATYSWDDLLRDKVEEWSGVRNYQARNNMKAMRKGDMVFIYHSVHGKEIVGTATVAREAHPDSTDATGTWECVDVRVGKALQKPVSLEQIKKNSKLRAMVLVNNSRLSVQPVTQKEFEEVIKMSQ